MPGMRVALFGRMLLLPFAFVLWCIMAAIGFFLGSTKGRSSEGLLLGLLLGPFGWIIVLLLPENGMRCPECRGVIVAGAGRCKNCATPLPRTHFAPPVAPVESESERMVRELNARWEREQAQKPAAERVVQR